ncbi:hypothetical protein AB0M39_38960 [Streptomyces sp. NPDC051907]|uniref:hypothetical protein n=1 Tax=Streptomyces sp. NPDC051907 TaxID=3155284 RepID=UPI0034403FD8
MARHTASSSRRTALLRAGATVAAAAAALGVGASAAQAAPASQLPPLGLDARGGGPAEVLTGALTNSVTGAGQLKSLQLNPLAKTGSDPLDNVVATQVADFKPISTGAVTGPLASGAALEDLPLVGGLTRVLSP